MAEAEITIGRELAALATTGGSFEEEQRELVWRRCRLLFLIGIAISILALLVTVEVPPVHPEGLTGLPSLGHVSAIAAHTISFLLGLGALYLAQRSRAALEAVALAVIAFNLALGIYNNVSHSPDFEPYFEMALLLFLPAAIIPWSGAKQIALAALALIWYPGLEVLMYAIAPETREFWTAVAAESAGSGPEIARGYIVWAFTGTAILGAVSVMVSRTLYTLRKTAHKAKRMGKYVIHGELGMGGMGQVYIAQHSLLCRPTALKVLKPDETNNPTSLARFEREVKLSATLTHPNTITIYDIGRTSDRSLYYAMEYLEGLDLQQIVDRFGPLTPSRTVFILRQVAGSLAEAHTRDIVHRDIKPANIFLTRRGGVYDFVKVLDFGLAKQIHAEEAEDAAEITKQGVLFGTPRYLAPETVYGKEKVDGRADIYSLGGVAYWMLAGRPPFISESSVEVIVDHVKTIPQRPSEVSEVVIPRELEDIVMKSLEKKPGDRFQSAWELDAALAAVAFDEPWSRERALEWWSLHGIIGDDALDCECFFPDEELPNMDVSSLITVGPTA